MRFKKASPLPKALIAELLNCSNISKHDPVSVIPVRSVERHVSAIHQVEITFKQREASLYWVKVHPENNGCAELEHNFLSDAHDHFLAEPNLSVLKPVAYLKNYNAMVTEHSPGEPLAAQVKNRLNIFSSFLHSDIKIKNNFYMCGKLLAKLHQQRLSNGELYSSEELFKYIDIRLKKLMEQSKLDEEFYNRLQKYFLDIKDELSEVNLIRVKTHGDYAPYNVLVCEGASEDELVMFDPAVGQYFGSLENYCSQYEDVIHFYKWTQEMFSPFVSQRTRDYLCSKFLQGYNENSKNPVDERSIAFEVFMMKYKVLSVFDTWPSLISKLTDKNSRIKAFESWFDETVSRA